MNSEWVVSPGGSSLMLAPEPLLALPVFHSACTTYDGAGLVQGDAFDFAGNLVSQTRRLTVGYTETPSWTTLDAATAARLEAEAFTTTPTFDALGRPVTRTTPDTSVTHLGYDDGGRI